MFTQDEILVAQMIVASQLPRVVVEAGGYTYLCYAKDAGALLTDAAWQVQRVDATGNAQFAAAGATSPSTRAFIHQADDPASLTYPDRSGA